MSKLSESFAWIVLALCCLAPALASGTVVALYHLFAKRTPHLYAERGTTEQGEARISIDLFLAPRELRRRRIEHEEPEQ